MIEMTASVREIKAMWDSGGMTPKGIAEEMELRLSEVYKILGELGYSQPAIEIQAGRVQVNLSGGEGGIEGLVNAYQEGMSMIEMQQKFRLGRDHINAVLVSEGVPVRSMAGKRVVLTAKERSIGYQRTLDEAVSWYEDGVPINYICEDLGISPRTLYIELEIQDVPLRRGRRS